MPIESTICPRESDSGEESDFWPNIGKGKLFYL